MIINAHSHLLPYPHEIPQFMKDNEIFWIDDDRNFMRQKNWSRPINGYGFFLDQKLEWMKRFNIDKAVILNLSQLYCNGFEKNITKDVIRFQNDYNAMIEKNHPDTFYGGFVVQPAYIDDALNEMTRCVKELKLKVLCLPSHYLNQNQEWISVADESCFPIFELANEYKLAVEIHPYDGEEIIKLKDQSWRFHLVWMCALTADTFHFFTLKDFPDRFPNIRTCFAHGNQYSMVNLGRRQQGFDGRPDLFPNTISPKENFKRDNVFVDSIVHDIDSLELLVKKYGISQILFGLDDPYPLGETDIVEGCYPGQLLNIAVERNIISTQQKSDIQHANIINWIG